MIKEIILCDNCGTNNIVINRKFEIYKENKTYETVNKDLCDYCYLAETIGNWKNKVGI